MLDYSCSKTTKLVAQIASWQNLFSSHHPNPFSSYWTFSMIVLSPAPLHRNGHIPGLLFSLNLDHQIHSRSPRFDTFVSVRPATKYMLACLKKDLRLAWKIKFVRSNMGSGPFVVPRNRYISCAALSSSSKDQPRLFTSCFSIGVKLLIRFLGRLLNNLYTDWAHRNL